MVGTDFGLKYWNCYGVIKMNKKESKERERVEGDSSGFHVG